jgi:hypothetical protein
MSKRSILRREELANRLAGVYPSQMHIFEIPACQPVMARFSEN